MKRLILVPVVAALCAASAFVIWFAPENVRAQDVNFGTGNVSAGNNLAAGQTVVGQGGHNVATVAAGSNGQVWTMVSGLPAWANSTGGGVSSITFSSPLTGGTITSTGTVGLSGPSDLTTFTSGTIPMGAGTSPFTASEITDVGLAGVVIGSPTGGAKGAGTINMTGCFINNVACGSGSVPSFSAITPGTNTSSAMVVGSGASLNFSGSGTINASTLGGATFAAPGAIGGTTPGTAAFTTLSATTLSGTFGGTPTYSGVPLYTGLSSVTCAVGLALDSGDHLGTTSCPASSFTLSPGLASTPTTYNPGTQTMTGGGTLSLQLFYEGHATSYTVASTDGGKLLTATAASVTFTAPNPGSVGTTGYTFGYDGTHGYTVTTAGHSASIYGCGSTGASISPTYAVSLTTDGTNYQCTPFGVSSGGGAVSNVSGTSGQVTCSPTTGSVVCGLPSTITEALTFGQVEGKATTQSGTTYTFAATDCGTSVYFTSNSAVTATIPASIVPAPGTECNILVTQVGTAKVFVNGSAVTPATLISANSYTGTSGTAGSVIGLKLTTISSATDAFLTGNGS